MGKGILKRKNTIKKMYLSQMIKEVERLSAENKALKEDPTSVIGKFIGQFNEVVSQNQRLSTLACAMIDLQGGSVKVTRDQIEIFRGKRLSIEINTPEGNAENLDTATEYVFSFKAVDATAPTGPSATPIEIPPCTDPECKLPKDLVHTHSVQPVAGDIVPDVPNADEPQSGKVGIVEEIHVKTSDLGGKEVISELATPRLEVSPAGARGVMQCPKCGLDAKILTAEGKFCFTCKPCNVDFGPSFNSEKELIEWTTIVTDELLKKTDQVRSTDVGYELGGPSAFRFSEQNE